MRWSKRRDTDILYVCCLMWQDKTTNSIVHSKVRILFVIRERERESLFVCLAIPRLQFELIIICCYGMSWREREKKRVMDEEIGSKVFFMHVQPCVLYCSVLYVHDNARKKRCNISVSICVDHTIHCCIYIYVGLDSTTASVHVLE